MTHTTCSHTGKRRFTSIIDAANELVVCAQKRDEGVKRRREQRTYFCSHCGAIHLTSQHRKKKKKK